MFRRGYSLLVQESHPLFPDSHACLIRKALGGRHGPNLALRYPHAQPLFVLATDSPITVIPHADPARGR